MILAVTLILQIQEVIFLMEVGPISKIWVTKSKLNTNSRAYDKYQGRFSTDFILFHEEEIEELDLHHTNEEDDSDDNNNHMEHLVNHVIVDPESPQNTKADFKINERFRKLEKEDEDSVSSNSEKDDEWDGNFIKLHQEESKEGIYEKPQTFYTNIPNNRTKFQFSYKNTGQKSWNSSKIVPPQNLEAVYIHKQTKSTPQK